MNKHGRKSVNMGNDPLYESARKYLQGKELRGQKELEKWSKTDVGQGLREMYQKNPTKARRVAFAIGNVERHLKRLNETLISQAFSTTPENVLKVVRVGSANSHRADFCTEVPLSTTDDAIFFIKMTYDNAPTDKQQSANEFIYEKAYSTSRGTAGVKTAAGNGSTTNAITVGNKPILPYKTLVLIDGILVAKDAGDGTLTAVTNQTWTVSSGTCVVATGVVTIITSEAVTAASTITIMYEWDSEQSDLYTQYPKIKLALSKDRFFAVPQMLGYTYTSMVELVLGTTGVGDAEALLLGAVGDEHAKAKDFKAIRMLRAIAKTNATYTFDANFAVAGELSYKSHLQKLLGVIRDIGGFIYNDIQRGEVNKIVAGSQAVTAMTYHDLWKSENKDTKTSVYLAGTLDGIEVYQCPAPSDGTLLGANEALLIYKNPLEGLDVGLAFGVLTELSASLAYPQFYIDGNVASVEDSMIINSKFVRLLTITNLPSYTS